VKQCRKVIAMQHVRLSATFDSRLDLRTGGTLRFELAVQLRAAFSMESTLLGSCDTGAWLFYGHTQITAMASLAISLRVVFDLSFHVDLWIGGFDVRIYWEQALAASLQVCFEASVEVLISDDGMGLARLRCLIHRYLRYPFSLSVPLEAGSRDASKLQRAKEQYQILSMAV